MAINTTLLPIESGYNLERINSNFNTISTALEKSLSREGDSPNHMEAHIDMNGFNILNVGVLNAEQITNQEGDVPVIVQGVSDWDVSTTYLIGELVRYDNTLYVALRETVGDQPDISTLDWDLVLEGGEDGVDGENGLFNGVVETKTGAYTVVAGDNGKILIMNSASPVTLSLTAAATLGSPFVVTLKNIGAGTCTIDPNSTEQIDGASTVAVLQNESLDIMCDGTAFRTLYRNEAAALPVASTTTQGIVELATGSEVSAATSDALAITPDAVKDAAAYVALTYAATIAIDHQAGCFRTVTLTGNGQFGNPSNVIPGYPLVISAKQDATGSRVPTWASNYKFGEAGAPTLSTTANAEDLIIFHARSATQIVYMGIVKGIQ